jgi:hypothetical protein
MRSSAFQVSRILNMVNLETNTVIASIDSDAVKQTVDTGVTIPVGTISVSSADTLPLANIPIGQQGFVTTTNKLYIYNGSGWYNIAAINNAPYWDSEANATYALSVDGTSTTVTIAAGDSDGTTLTYTATGDSNFDAIATVTKDSDNGRTFYITAIDSENSASPTGGSGILTFRASDGIDQASTASTFSIDFGTDWSSYSTLTIAGNSGVQGARMAQNKIIPTNQTGTVFMVTSNEGVSVVNRSGSTLSFDTTSGSNPSYSSVIYWGTSKPGGGFRPGAFNSAGDKLVIGNSSDTTAGSNSGSIAIFTKSGSTWTQTQTINSPQGGNSSQFGQCVDMTPDGTYIIVTRPSYDYGVGNVWLNDPRVYGALIYKWNGSSYALDGEMNSSVSNNQGMQSDFGNTGIKISSDGSYALISSQSFRPSNYAYDQSKGRAFVFKRTGSTWALDATITPIPGEQYGYFGSSLSSNNDMTTIAIGEFGVTSSDRRGQLSIFTRPDVTSNTWTREALITQPLPAANSYFSEELELDSSGDILTVTGRPWHLGSSHPDRFNNRIYIYQRSGSSWSLSNTIIPSAGPFDGTGISRDGKFIAGGIADNTSLNVFSA